MSVPPPPSNGQQPGNAQRQSDSEPDEVSETPTEALDRAALVAKAVQAHFAQKHTVIAAVILTLTAEGEATINFAQVTTGEAQAMLEMLNAARHDLKNLLAIELGEVLHSAHVVPMPTPSR